MKAILQFSGGKDSTALLWSMRDRLSEIEVCYVDTGGVVPHVREYVNDMADRLGVNLTVIKPEIDVMTYTEANGLPADVVPVWNVPGFGSGQPIQAAVACCNAMLWQPMAAYVKASGAKTVLRGSKASDPHLGLGNAVEDGIAYVCPLWDWTDADVFAYLKREGVPLASHYGAVNDGLDCWGCTAYLTAPYGADKLRFMREHYPDLWPTLADRIDRMRNAVSSEWARVTRAIDGVSKWQA